MKCQNENNTTNSLYQLPEYFIIHKKRINNHKGDGVRMFLHETIIYKLINDLSINDNDTDSQSIENYK